MKTDFPPAIAATREFLSLTSSDQPPSIKALACSLDRLAMVYHDAPRGEPNDDDLDPPERDYELTCSRLRVLFSDLGFYTVVDPLDELPVAAMGGDAIDDLADIVGDLSEVSWRFDTFGSDDAHWYFRFLFEAHWGRHLRELSLFLHAKQFGWAGSDTL